MNKRFCPQCRRSFGDLEHCPSDEEVLIPLPTGYPEVGGEVAGRYRITEHLADGGMSRVFRGEDDEGGQDVAIKVLNHGSAIHPYSVERFYRQARVSLTLQHPSVVAIEHYGPTESGRHVIVMELLKGETLLEVLEREGRLPWERAIRLILTLCEGLGHAHGKGIIHRDIKPDNIYLCPAESGGEELHLLDFGIAQVSGTLSLTSEKTEVMGTPAYMSPEQIRGEVLDGRSDLYALGILLFEMLAGQRPFLGEDPVVVCRMQLYDRAPSLGSLLPRKAYVPPALKAVVDELLLKSRSSRLPSIGALMGRLSVLLPGHTPALGLLPPPPPRPRAVTMDSFRLPTGEWVTGDLVPGVVLLHVRLDTAPGRPTLQELPDWASLIAGWRGLLEASGAFLREPAPGVFQIVFGLFRPKALSTYSDPALRCAVELKRLVEDYSGRFPKDRIAFRASVIPAATKQPTEAPDDTSILALNDAQTAHRLAMAAPLGGVLVAKSVVKQLAGTWVWEAAHLPADVACPSGAYQLLRA